MKGDERELVSRKASQEDEGKSIWYLKRNLYVEILPLSSPKGECHGLHILSNPFMISSTLFRLTLLLVEPMTSLELIPRDAAVA